VGSLGLAFASSFKAGPPFFFPPIVNQGAAMSSFEARVAEDLDFSFFFRDERA